MNMFKKYHINSVFFSSFFLFIVLILIAIILLSYRFSTNELVNTTTEYQKQNLYQLSEELGDNLQSFEEYSVILSRQQLFRDVISGRQTSAANMRQTSSLTNDFSNIIYSIPALHSVEIYMNSPPVDNIQYPVRYFPLEDVYDSSWYSQLENIAYSWLGNRDVETMAGEHSVISLGRKINSSNGRLQSIVIVNLDPITAESWLRNFSDDSHLIMLDENGAIVASTGNNEIGDESFEELIEFSDSQNSFQYPLQDDTSMEDSLVVTTAIPQTNWTIMEITPYRDILAGSRQVATLLALLGIFGTLIVLIGTMFLTKKFTEPIHELTRVMKSYQLNKASIELPKGYNNEFGELFTGFEELTNRVEELYASLGVQYQRQRETELKALQANINPHFLYNTLDQMNWTAIESGNIEISRMIELLGKMLRIGLSKGESVLTLEDELKYLEYYLRLQQIQMENRLTFHIDLPAGLQYYYVPKLTFQPFVENSIIHGFRESRSGNIHINVGEQGDQLCISIADDGMGFASENQLKHKDDLGGYGIKNVKERLHVYFGDEAFIHIKSSPDGTEVQILIPKVNDKDLLTA
ncbi:sensor histidine kinase [Alkalicoccus daliensis]|uniref:Two-component system, sensor histidine kinase YesM n=1 Tax=Alkalicoccus daliensis TaxID=745820 RepID=A0A1H0EZL2_9BACI|nr:sensor histidine kinase [Alkalicoccus daliensis]SDN87749.1 two-component system, sensor histidine kinase YesM [Alkalicoccus daliensis]